MLDYLIILILLAGPRLAGMQGIDMEVSYALAGLLLVLSLVTAYPLSMIKKLAFGYHGVIEFYFAIGMVIFGFATVRSGGWLLLAVGVALFGVFSATDFSDSAITIAPRAGRAA